MKIFYQNYRTREGIESSNPVEATLKQALAIFDSLDNETENFFGIIDNSDKTIQFVLESENKWLVDIINLPSLINDQLFANYHECVSIIENIYTLNKVLSLPSMIKVNVRSETLQEKLFGSN